MISIYHALFSCVFFLLLFECLQDQGIKFSTHNQANHNNANKIGIYVLVLSLNNPIF